MNKEKEIARVQIGTLPRVGVLNTVFYRGVEEIKAELIDFPSNPYKALVTMVCATWGGVWDTYRWAKLTPQARLYVVHSVLARKTLPNAMEALSFTFEVAGLSRSAFDQIARARIGAVFGSMGWRDNCHADIGFRVPEAIYADDSKLAQFVDSARRAKRVYVEMLRDQGNWQDARAILPISALHRFSCAFSYMALQNFMSKRLRFNEQADTVATAWLMRHAVASQFPLLADYLRPQDDWAKRCLEHEGDEFGNLFRCSGRWPCDQAGDEFTFNHACANEATISRQLRIFIPHGTELMPDRNQSINDISPQDRALLEAS